jgi:hypothetical protein
MEAANPDVKVREALSIFAQYLSDTIPPVQAIEPVGVLLKESPQLMASAIVDWVPSQFRDNGEKASAADYLFHAVSKLQYLVHLQLIPERAMAPYLAVIKQLLLNHCLPGERRFLQEDFDHMGASDTAMTVPIGYIHRRMSAGRCGAGLPGAAETLHPGDRRETILRDRLISAVRQPPTDGEERHEDPVPRLIAMAASDARSDEEFRRLQENLKSLGIESGTDHIYRALGRSLPGWMIETTGTDAVKSRNPAVEAMGQIIHLAEDRWEGGKRFRDMVQAAVEQFNTGSFTRAATMLDLALGIGSDEKLDPAAVAGIRKTEHKSLDLNQLRNLAKQPDKRHLLLKVLNFFDAFTAENLLKSLQNEGRREQRMLLLDLLEAHGGTAHRIAFEGLKELLAGSNLATEWYFARNLVCILNRTPSPGDITPREEIELIAPLTRLSLSAPLVKEAIKFAGQTKCVESEELLISTADKLERVVLESAASGRDSMPRLSLLDRTIFTLAHYATPGAYGRVVKHGISRRKGLGDTAARLAYLSGQDLSTDKESLALLIQFLMSKTPRKLLGMTIRRSENEQLLTHVVRALSATPAPIVRKTFENIAAQFPETKFGQAAAVALKEFEASDTSAVPAERMLTGDLDLFGLPDLLQQLKRMQVTGILTLRDAKGNPGGTLSLHAGRMQDCSMGDLTGIEAAYQLLEVPLAGTFVFQGKRNNGTTGKSPEPGVPDLGAVLSEGMRRYDELQRARALVPDFAMLRRKGPRPALPGGKEDPELAARIWEKTRDGASPVECEAACRTDSYRIRTLLARWIEEGVLTVE